MRVSYAEKTATATSCAPMQPQPTSSPFQGPKPNYTPLPSFKPCLIDIDRFETLLKNHPNQFLVSYIVDGLRNGFDIGFTGPCTATLPKNLKSALQNKGLIQNAIDKDISRVTQLDHSLPLPSP